MTAPRFEGPFEAIAWKNGPVGLCLPFPRWSRRLRSLRKAQEWLRKKVKDAKAEGGAVIFDLATHQFIWGINPSTGEAAYQ